jgi:hypothetical protein
MNLCRPYSTELDATHHGTGGRCSSDYHKRDAHANILPLCSWLIEAAQCRNGYATPLDISLEPVLQQPQLATEMFRFSPRSTSVNKVTRTNFSALYKSGLNLWYELFPWKPFLEQFHLRNSVYLIPRRVWKQIQRRHTAQCLSDQFTSPNPGHGGW